MSDQVKNPEDWFSHNEAHIFQTVESCEEAKMEPTVSEQPQTEQPGHIEVPIEHVIAEQQHNQQGKIQEKHLSHLKGSFLHMRKQRRRSAAW